MLFWTTCHSKTSRETLHFFSPNRGFGQHYHSGLCPHVVYSKPFAPGKNFDTALTKEDCSSFAVAGCRQIVHPGKCSGGTRLPSSGKIWESDGEDMMKAFMRWWPFFGRRLALLCKCIAVSLTTWIFGFLTKVKNLRNQPPYQPWWFCPTFGFWYLCILCSHPFLLHPWRGRVSLKYVCIFIYIYIHTHPIKPETMKTFRTGTTRTPNQWCSLLTSREESKRKGKQTCAPVWGYAHIINV